MLAYFVTRFVPKDWHGLQWPVFRPLIMCGQQSLAVFCVGVFLSFAGHFALMTGSGSLLAQVLVSAAGIAIMTLVAYYISWSRQQDEPLPSTASGRASIDAAFLGPKLGTSGPRTAESTPRRCFGVSIKSDPTAICRVVRRVQMIAKRAKTANAPR